MVFTVGGATAYISNDNCETISARRMEKDLSYCNYVISTKMRISARRLATNRVLRILRHTVGGTGLLPDCRPQEGLDLPRNKPFGNIHFR